MTGKPGRRSSAPAAPARHPFEARLGGPPDPRLQAILKRRVARQLDYFPDELAVDRAHTVMLLEQGVLEPADGAAILRELAHAESDGVGGLKLDATRASIFWHIEARLTAALGDAVGGRLHIGRSHNDILPTMSRLAARRRLLAFMEAVLGLQDSLLVVSRNHVGSVMPGYTALQHGQPWTFGHYLSGWVFAFGRDLSRLRHAYGTTNLSPLGASALAGSSWPLDRARTAALLGFNGPLENSRDAGFGTKDYVAEIIGAVAIAMSNLSALCSDLYLWSSTEFGMIEIADEFSGSSSFMPQKKNAWPLDWARGAAGNAIGSFASALAAMKGTSSTDGALQDYPEVPLRETLEVATEFFAVNDGVISTMTVHEDVMKARAVESWATASALADLLVRRGDLSYRQAHAIVGRLVRNALARGALPQDVTAADLAGAAGELKIDAPALTDGDVRAALDPAAFIASRVTAGSVNPSEVRRMLGSAARQVSRDRRWVTTESARAAAALEALQQEVEVRMRIR